MWLSQLVGDLSENERRPSSQSFVCMTLKKMNSNRWVLVIGPLMMSQRGPIPHCTCPTSALVLSHFLMGKVQQRFCRKVKMQQWCLNAPTPRTNDSSQNSAVINNVLNAAAMWDWVQAHCYTSVRCLRLSAKTQGQHDATPACGDLPVHTGSESEWVWVWVCVCVCVHQIKWKGHIEKDAAAEVS